MAERAIVWTKTATIQRRQVLKYWLVRNQSPEYPERLIQQIDNTLATIRKNPESAKRADFANTRTATMGHFSIFYQFTSTQIIVTAFWDNRQDPQKLLELLKPNKAE